MAIDQDSLKKTRNPGVFRLPDGRLLAKVSVRTPDCKVMVRKQILPVDASESAAVQMVLSLKEQVRNPPVTTPTHHPQDTSQTLEDYCNQWLAVRSKRLTPKTKVTYVATTKSFILPRLGHMRCRDLRRGVI